MLKLLACVPSVYVSFLSLMLQKHKGLLALIIKKCIHTWCYVFAKRCIPCVCVEHLKCLFLFSFFFASSDQFDSSKLNDPQDFHTLNFILWKIPSTNNGWYAAGRNDLHGWTHTCKMWVTVQSEALPWSLTTCQSLSSRNLRKGAEGNWTVWMYPK